ncbi:hypothetical protein WDW86_04920 [Bdellovibrionota bacterium FG-2]
MNNSEFEDIFCLIAKSAGRFCGIFFDHLFLETEQAQLAQQARRTSSPNLPIKIQLSTPSSDYDRFCDEDLPQKRLSVKPKPKGERQ